MSKLRMVLGALPRLKGSDLARCCRPPEADGSPFCHAAMLLQGVRAERPA
jgi:hypothetical protein